MRMQSLNFVAYPPRESHVHMKCNLVVQQGRRNCQGDKILYPSVPAPYNSAAPKKSFEARDFSEFGAHRDTRDRGRSAVLTTTAHDKAVRIHYHVASATNTPDMGKLTWNAVSLRLWHSTQS